MPGFNQSGPEGQGPVTGKGRGMCQRTDYSAFSGVDVGRGRGRGMGTGQGMAQGAGMGRAQGEGMGRMPVSATKSAGSVNELESLKVQYESARTMMKELQEKIAAMEARQK